MKRKMKVIDAVRAHLAADEMGKLPWTYETALALVKVKRATQDEMEFYAAGERELVERFAKKDENGNIRVTERGAFTLNDSAQAGEYERARWELGETETQVDFAPLRVKAPETIRPEWIEALEGLIEFEG